MFCYLKEKEIDDKCLDYKCMYFGACYVEHDETIEKEVESHRLNKHKGYTSEGFQTSFEDDDIVESMSLDEDSVTKPRPKKKKRLTAEEQKQKEASILDSMDLL